MKNLFHLMEGDNMENKNEVFEIKDKDETEREIIELLKLSGFSLSEIRFLFRRIINTLENTPLK